MQIIAETPRLTIREFVLHEEETYLNHFNDQEVCLYLPKRSRQERISIFHMALTNYSDNKLLGIWGMFGKNGGYFVGSCLLRPYNNEPSIIELGYSIDREYWGKGIGTEMAKAMIRHGFADENITSIVALTSLGNIASQRVLEKSGFIRLDNLIKEGEELAFFNAERI